MNMLLGLHLTYARIMYIIPEAEGRIALELQFYSLSPTSNASQQSGL